MCKSDDLPTPNINLQSYQTTQTTTCQTVELADVTSPTLFTLLVLLMQIIFFQQYIGSVRSIEQEIKLAWPS